MAALTSKQQRFVEEYLVDLNAKQAAIRAGYALSSAEDTGRKLLGKPDVADAVATLKADRSRRTQLSADAVIEELRKIAFSDIRRAVRWRSAVSREKADGDGAPANEVTLLDSERLDDDTAAALAEVSQTDRGGLKVKMHDKLAALEKLGKHLGLFPSAVQVSGPNGGPIDVRGKTPREMTDEELLIAMAGDDLFISYLRENYRPKEEGAPR